MILWYNSIGDKMQEYINNIIDNLQNISATMPFIVSILFCFLMVAMESILPILPLGVFVALSMILLGKIFGFFVSWIATSCGCLLSFILVRKIFGRWAARKLEVSEKAEKIMKKIDKITFPEFVVITALPFTPAFLINISAGLSRMRLKKFIVGIIIAKIFIVYFWGFIGTTLIQSVTNPVIMLRMSGMLVLAYFLSRMAMKKYNLY